MSKRKNSKIAKIDSQISIYKSLLKALGKERVEAYRDTFLKCGFCGKRSKVSKITFINKYWWDENTGSPTGGYFRHGDYRWECPHCDQHIPNTFGPEFDDIVIPMKAFKGDRNVKNR